DGHVTGVQTCALPIFVGRKRRRTQAVIRQVRKEAQIFSGGMVERRRAELSLQAPEWCTSPFVRFCTHRTHARNRCRGAARRAIEIGKRRVGKEGGGGM